MTTQFKVDPRKNTVFGKVDSPFIVNAENVHVAADIAATKIFKDKNTSAHRQTGDMHGSGMFQCYIPGAGGLNSIGSYFHVSVATDVEAAKYA